LHITTTNIKKEVKILAIFELGTAGQWYPTSSTDCFTLPLNRRLIARATAHIIKHSNAVTAHMMKAHSSVKTVTGLWVELSEVQRHPEARRFTNFVVHTYFNIM
jgi:hypothetical protein